jgi:HEAT repeat protein
MKLLQFPLYVTAHDFDFIACFDPRPESARTPIRKPSTEELVSNLIAKLGDEDPQIRFRAVTKFYSLGPAATRAVPSLIQRLEDANQATRQLAAMVLTQIDPASDLVASALVARLELEELPQARHEIIRALGHTPTKQAVEALANALSEEDPKIRRYAAISLKVLGSKAKNAAPVLQRLMETETDEMVRMQATLALGRMLQE